jgi:hypothetical protein
MPTSFTGASERFKMDGRLPYVLVSRVKHQTIEVRVFITPHRTNHNPYLPH